MVMLMLLTRPENVRDEISLINLCLCLPLRMSYFLREGNYTGVCVVVCYMAAKRGK